MAFSDGVSDASDHIERPAARPKAIPPVNPDRSRQGERYRNTRLRKMDDIFRNKTFDIEKTVILPPGQVFITVFGRPARSGYVLKCRETGERIAIGFKMLKQIHDLYLCVSLPSRLRPINYNARDYNAQAS